MTLYVLRHAIALEKDRWKGPDDQRPLTPEGRRKMKTIARGLRNLKLSFDAILTSPYRRAYDTAHIVAKEFGARKKMKVIRELASDGDPKKLIRRLALDYRREDSVLLLVGHEPYLSRLLSVLISGTPDVALELKKGGLAALNASSLTYGRCASLRWLASPRLLRALA